MTPSDSELEKMARYVANYGLSKKDDDFEFLVRKICIALRTVRDETIEASAVIAESHTSTDGACPESIANAEGYRTAVNQITTAIRNQWSHDER